MLPKPLSEQWAAVFTGSPALADLHAQRLQACGIPVFTPDRNLKLLDQSVVGGGQIFDLSVLVPRDQLARARAVLAEISPLQANEAVPDDEPSKGE